ncbi:MAG: hypothetical protein JW987_02845 [Anaerolineaceae bacterium]|nr:hypothetical protein [Anaerolineaceae bacterium]
MKLPVKISQSWFPLLILALCVVAFGRWALTLGYFWDDFPIRWIIREYGMPGLQQYYSIDRPFMAWLYQVTTTLINFTPLSSHLFALIWRVISSVALWGLLRVVWPRQRDLAAWAALLFTFYPGFGQQYVSFVYGHYYILVAAFFASLSLTVLAVRNPRRFWLYTAGAMLLSAVNLFCWEYYFLLDTLRPLLVWWVLGEQGLGWKKRLGQALLAWLPCLLVFLGAIYWRSTILGYQTYQPVFFSELSTAPWSAVLHLAQRIALDLWKTTGLAWWKAVQTAGTAPGNWWYVAVVLAAALLAAFFFALQPKPERGRNFLPMLLTSLLALVLAGGPFWLINIDVNLNFSSDRFVLPFMLGGSLLAAALLMLLPRQVHLPLLAALVGLSAGVQYNNGYAYRSDWEEARRLIWQLSWRAPGLEPGTTLLMNDNSFTYYTDNSLTAALNWLYQPEPGSRMDYMLMYPSVRLGGKLPALEGGRTISVDYRSDVFEGSTSQVVALIYQPPGCLRVLDPEIEAVNTSVQEIMLKALPLSSTQWISSQGIATVPVETFGKPPAATWCEFYEKADLARQLGDWAGAVQAWQGAQAARLWPQDAVEYLPFIEAYAHSGGWDQAVALSREAAKPGSQYPQMVCRLWERIEREVSAGAERDAALESVRAELNCE